MLLVVVWLVVDQFVEFDGGIGELKIGAHVGVADKMHLFGREMVEHGLDFFEENGAFLSAKAVDATEADRQESGFDQGQRFELTFDEIHRCALRKFHQARR